MEDEMSNEMFQVKPVQTYDGARYPSAYQEGKADDDAMEQRHHPLTLVVAMLLVLGLGVGMIGCYLRSDVPPEEPLPDGGGDGGGDGDPPPPCTGDDMQCTDDGALEICDDEAWVRQDCNERCTELLGDGAYSIGCDLSAEEPCLCQYDIIEGDVDPCYPNDAYCQDERTVVFCDDDWAPQDCEAYCDELLGSIDAFSNGCNAEAEDPCQCEYGIEDGIMAHCDVGEVVCADEMTVGVCVDGVDFTYQDCNERCVAEHGSDWISPGCNAEAEDPCQCMYGIVDGEMVECSPGDVRCAEDGTFAVCVDNMWSWRSCEDYCDEMYGPDATSGGCDVTAEEPCMCVSSRSGSGGGEK
jgi:hypothetical protein